MLLTSIFCDCPEAREISFQGIASLRSYTVITKLTPSSLVNLSNESQLGYYLAGHLEGDGNIFVPKSKDNNPEIRLLFGKYELPFAKVVQSRIGGSIDESAIEKDSIIFLRIVGSNQIYQFLQLINGKLRTPKIYHVNALINWFKTFNPNHPISTYEFNQEIDTSPLFSNAWLSGFWETDGSFAIAMRNNEAGRIEVKARLEQRQIDIKAERFQEPALFAPIMETIASSLGVKLRTVKHTLNGITRDYYAVESSSPTNLKLFIDYLDVYPLFGTKSLNYKDFRTVVLMMLNKEHLTMEGRNQISTIRSQFNRNRIHYTLKNLDSFYSNPLY